MARGSRAGQEGCGARNHTSGCHREGEPPANDAAKGAAATATRAAAPSGNAAAAVATPQKEFKYFAFLSDKAYTTLEQVSLWVVLLIAVAGLVYAGALVGQVYGADEGTEKFARSAKQFVRGRTLIWVVNSGPLSCSSSC